MGAKLLEAERVESGGGGLPLRAVVTHRIPGCPKVWLVSPEPSHPLLSKLTLRSPDLPLLGESFLSTAEIWVLSPQGRKSLFGLVNLTQGKHLSFCSPQASAPAILSAWEHFSPLLNITSSGKPHPIIPSWVR